MTDQPVLSDEEIDTLNAARRILMDARDRTPFTASGGKCYVALEEAEHGIFTALNWLNATSIVPLSITQMHLRGEELMA